MTRAPDPALRRGGGADGGHGGGPAAAVGDVVEAGTVVAVLESMKMEHPVPAGRDGWSSTARGASTTRWWPGQVLVVLDPPARTRRSRPMRRPRRGRGCRRRRAGARAGRPGRAGAAAGAAGRRRPPRGGGQAPRAGAAHGPGERGRPVRRRARSRSTAGSRSPPRRRRRDARGPAGPARPADGLITGIGRVNGDLVGEERARCAVVAYDYTVLAGTQGQRNHHKKDRMFELAERLRLPVVLFAEGGGGRPGRHRHAGDRRARHPGVRAASPALSGLVPTVGIAAGRCFAGNAALLGCCDVVIATADSNIGMGGPAMIEGGGLGVVRPEDVGPIDVQVANGVVDVAVADEAEAVAVAKRYLVVLPGPGGAGRGAPTRRALRDVVPEHRKTRLRRPPGDRRRWPTTGSVLELRAGFGHGDRHRAGPPRGPPVGRGRQRPRATSAGPSTPTAADKAARFLQLCDAYDLPVLSLCDTPGFLVGPDGRGDGPGAPLLAACSCRRASITVPFGHGRAAQGLRPRRPGHGGRAASRRRSSRVAWPTGEFGGMGLEGRGAARVPRRARGHRRPRGARRRRSTHGRGRLPARPGAQHGRPPRDRRRDRPRRDPRAGCCAAFAVGAAAPAPHRQEAPRASTPGTPPRPGDRSGGGGPGSAGGLREGVERLVEHAVEGGVDLRHPLGIVGAKASRAAP